VVVAVAERPAPPRRYKNNSNKRPFNTGIELILLKNARPSHFEPVLAYVGLGANLGKAIETVREAMAQLAALPFSEVVQTSSLYHSAPVDSSGPDYINAVAALRTRLHAPGLLEALHHIEQLHGRARPYRNAPRTLDLDLLLYGQAQISSPLLTVPHPRMHERAFVLLPLHEIAPQWVSQKQCEALQSQRIERLPNTLEQS
jgi:2-amino-4-hydroxy-6-hydroxymethyldihydropteridine diphosphokinase